MERLNVHLKLNALRCHDEGDSIGSAEPYLWTVFFKIDGATAVVTPRFALQGTATVVGTPGDHGNLPNHDVDAGEVVPIPAAIGEFRTELRPIPLQQPFGDIREVSGVVGVIAVLMEQDNTPRSAVAAGHTRLNQAVQDSLNALIPTLGFLRQEPTDADIAAMTKAVGDAVTKAVSDGVGFWDWLGAGTNMDDKIGSEVFRFSHADLEARGVNGIPFQKRFRSHGDWELHGRVSATPVGVSTGSLRVVVSGLPTTVPGLPVRVVGSSNFIRAINRTTTLSALRPGEYTISAAGFSTGQGKPTCRAYTPSPVTGKVTVQAGQAANASVGYTSERCDAEPARPGRPAGRGTHADQSDPVPTVSDPPLRGSPGEVAR